MINRYRGASLLALFTCTALVMPVAATAASLQGHVSSAGIPIVDSTVTLFRAGNMSGDNVVALGAAVSNAGGKFDIDYDEPGDSGDVLYLIAQGGRAKTDDAAASYSAIKLSTVLGSAFPKQVTVNERTTVATAYTMNQFLLNSDISGPQTGIVNAAAILRNLVALNSGAIGQVLRNKPNGNQTETLASFNTLANMLAACVQDQALCATLFNLTAPPVDQGATVPPQDTLQAILNIARYPAQNTKALLAYARTEPAYSPALQSSPDAWTLALRYDGNGKEMDGPGFIAFDEDGNAWIANNYLWKKGTRDPKGVVCGADDVMALSPVGKDLPGAPYRGGGANGAGFGITFDKYGFVWQGNFGFAGSNCTDKDEVLELSRSVSKYNTAGEPLSPDNAPGMPGGFGGNGTIFGPQGMSSDPASGNLWIANCRNTATMSDGSTPGSVVTLMNAADETQVRSFQPFTLVTPEQAAPEFLPKPFGMTVDINGVAWVAGNNINQVVGIDEHGNEVANFGKRFDEDPPEGEARKINRPMGIASDSLGGIWVANSGVVDIACGYQFLEEENAIDGEDSTFISLQGANILDSEGNATNSYDGALASIAYIRPDGSGDYILNQYVGGGVIVPWGIALDGNDNVWIANFDGQRLSFLCGANTHTCPAGSRQTGAPISPDSGYSFSGLVRNTGVSIDPSGNVWLTNNWLQDPIQTNPGGREVVVFLGLAKPVQTPLLGFPRVP